jgi:hypothetical protein
LLFDIYIEIVSLKEELNTVVFDASISKTFVFKDKMKQIPLVCDHSREAYAFDLNNAFKRD